MKNVSNLFVSTTIIIAAALLLSSCDQVELTKGSEGSNEATGIAQAQPEFGGKIARSYADSVEWWPPEQVPPEGAPFI